VRATTVRRVGFATVLALAATAALAVPADAEIKAQCLISGDAKVVDKADPTLGVRLIGGKGSYTFNSLSFVCVGVTKGAPNVVSTATSTSGWYNNIVCGTGKVVGTVTSIADPKYNAVFSGKKFAIDLSALVGHFYWHTWAKEVLPIDGKLGSAFFPPGKGLEPKNWQLAGEVVAGLPSKNFTPPNTPPGNCTKAFSLSGSVAIDEGGTS
jgi:hypothetical protein